METERLRQTPSPPSLWQVHRNTKNLSDLILLFSTLAEKDQMYYWGRAVMHLFFVIFVKLHTLINHIKDTDYI